MLRYIFVIYICTISLRLLFDTLRIITTLDKNLKFLIIIRHAQKTCKILKVSLFIGNKSYKRI